ncbi:PAS domain-containing sensor histidine kinase [Methyloligella sp. 2.7D]|uniref:sensor histidine kinase NtrY-like n=1 Tax=unclassified Methyloligella TaxID=2625955 RepID=UPI00157CC391|nr:PAS domain-containing sensor histidine kinase [Methyloligella sp. GL2]QKP77483.1 PAS domain-containing sensor histidine kinase [Methyloligella sp. GL2]
MSSVFDSLRKALARRAGGSDTSSKDRTGNDSAKKKHGTKTADAPSDEAGASGVAESIASDADPLEEEAPAAASQGRKRWSRRRITFTVGLVIMVLSLCSGLATYLILTGLTPIVPTHTVVVGVLLINAALVLAMVAILAWQVTGLWKARRRKAAGAQLLIRVAGLFSVIAVAPAILLAIFASISLDRGLDHWFSDRTKSIIQNSIDVATAYLQEHGQVIRADTLGMAKDIDEAVGLVRSRPQGFGNFLTAQAAIRSIPIAYLIDEKGKILATASTLPDFPYRPPPQQAMDLAKKGQVIVIAPGHTNMVGALKSLDNFNDTYLYVIRPVNAKVLTQLRQTRASVAEYQVLEQRRAGVQVAFGLMYVAIALTLLLSAIWIGMWFAGRLVAPIGKLMSAANQISEGNLDIEVPVNPADGDLATLGTTFNTMASELKSQHDELVGANSKLDERRRFMEAVLSSVTAGVIGVDLEGAITLVNRSAETLLDLKAKGVMGKPLAKIIPQFGPSLKRAQQKQSRRLITDQITLRVGDQERYFAVRVTSKGAGKTMEGYVVTFDDITELVSAQRSTAWADIARRIAHEIKNPLTPIQLSAERIRRKYGDSITKDREIFEQCTDTIIRQVSDIGRMVDEFSDFARMPKPVMEPHDLREILREAIFLFQVSRPEIDFEVELPDEPVIANCDRRLLSQALTNLVKNASEAIDSAFEADPERTEKGKITAKLDVPKGDHIQITVIDNGCGLPEENRQRLVEPYMTTRTKGTGLGLAIVQRIVEQHGGTLFLSDAPKDKSKGKSKDKSEDKSEQGSAARGAAIRIDLPIVETEEAAEEPPAQSQSSPATSDESQAETAKEKEGVTDGV